ncbi:hypothetical protein DFH05DRAFT_686317 [Lentinula detonsa]|uniref:Uncharacterized protein n=1 Tax=Lentinula detonsa TaxID=2804962 RepID=A0A9W8U217_9AGAR|nr:hypothetical protein DFH05DRAFT_686317 [Lentinula detonsa]
MIFASNLIVSVFYALSLAFIAEPASGRRSTSPAPKAEAVPEYIQTVGKQGVLKYFHELAPFEQRSDEIFVGMMIDIWYKAYEYNLQGTLTAVPASHPAVGEGAYLSPAYELSPALNKPDFWACAVFGDRKIIDEQKKIFVPMSNRMAELTGFPGSVNEHLNSVIAGSGDRREHILITQRGRTADLLMMVIPPPFLVESRGYSSMPHGQNSLKLRVRCYPQDKMPDEIKALKTDYNAWPEVVKKHT